MSIPATSEVVAKLRAGEIPAAALRMGGTAVVFEDNANAKAKSVKVHLKARSREPINHPWWGTIWHDLSTMRSKPKVALDDSHGVEVGYGRPFTTDYGLECDGVVIENEDDPTHESNRILFNLKSGIPQEASIDFSGDFDVLEVPEGLSTQVNGLMATGPCLVVQNWPLRAIALCKEGADPTTESTMLSSKGVKPRSVTTLEKTMPTEMPVTQTSTDAIAPVTSSDAVTLTVTQEAEPISTPLAESPAVPETPEQPAELATESVAGVEATDAPVSTVTEAAPPSAEVAVEAPVLTQTPAVVESEPDLILTDHEERAMLAEVERLTQEVKAKDETIANLQSRITALAGGAPPVVGVPKALAVTATTWSQAMDSVQREHKDWAIWQVAEETRKRFPALFEAVNKPK